MIVTGIASTCQTMAPNTPARKPTAAPSPDVTGDVWPFCSR